MRRRTVPPPARRQNPRKLWQINKYLWMSLGFVAVYLPVAQAQGILSVSPWFAWFLAFLALADGGSRTILAYQRGGQLPDSWAWFFTFLDIVLISASISITGGIDSDLWLLYFVVMIFESLYATVVQKRLMDVSVSVAYFLAAVPHYLHHTPSTLTPGEFARILGSRLFFLILVSSLGRRISANMDERNRELALLHEQMATGEERARIAREVHDGLGHALVSSILRLELAARLIRKAPEEAEAILKEEVPALRAAWNEGRDLAFHLHPWEMNATREGELIDTLRRHTGRFAERTGIIVNLHAEGEVWNLRPEAAFGLTRILQEAMTNAAKHAQPKQIDVMLTRMADDRVRAVIHDDGKGFDPQTQNTGLGLQGMRDRVEDLDGTFQIDSAPGRGTTIELILPG